MALSTAKNANLEREAATLRRLTPHANVLSLLAAKKVEGDLLGLARGDSPHPPLLRAPSSQGKRATGTVFTMKAVRTSDGGGDFPIAFKVALDKSKK